MEQIILSIILPVYNAERFIDKAIESVLKQSYTNWELILVDNCSTDSTIKKCKQWIKQDTRIKGIFHEKNLGIGQSRTDGIKLAKGDYIGFMDSDDYIHPQMFELMIQAARNNNSKIVMCERKALYTSNEPDFEKYSYEQFSINCYDLEKIYSEMFGTSQSEGPFLVVWTKFFKSEIIKDINVVFQGGEDAYFSFKAYNLAKEITFIKNLPLYFFVIRYDSESRFSFNNNHLMQLIVYLNMEKETYENNKDLYHFVSLKTYKKILCTKYDCRNSELRSDVYRVLKNEYSGFKKRFWRCKKIPFYKKLMMDMFYYFPFTYSLIK